MRRLPALLFLLALVPPAVHGADAPVPDEARLRAMTARFAPVDIGADVSALPESERQALAKMVEAAQVMDALFLRQVWAGNEALLLELLADHVAARPAPAALLPASTRDRGRGSTTTRRSCPARRRSPTAANFYPAGATKAEVEAWIDGAAARPSGRPRPASSRRSAATPDGTLRRRALQRRVPGRAGAGGRAAARGRGR